MYQCLDGWICVACGREEHVGALLQEVLSGEVVDPSAHADVATRLSYEMFGATAHEWAARLRAVGVPCEVVREESWLRSVLLDDAMVERGRVNEIEHPLHGRARVIGQLFSLDTHPGVRRDRSPLLGEHTDELLAELGLDDAARDSLAAGGVVIGPLATSATPS